MKRFLAIYKKDLRSMFMGATAYILITLFLIISGSLLWGLKSPYNILDNGYTDLSDFFEYTPWLFIVFTSVLTMKSFSEEYKTGTIEILLSKPIKIPELVLAKFAAVWTVLVVALIPTLLYVLSIYNLSENKEIIGFGVYGTSYLGLLLVITQFSAIGVACSAFTKNQVIAFLTAASLMILFYFGFVQLDASISGGFSLDKIASQYHYENFTKGLIDTRSLIYFVSVSITFLFIAQHKILKIKQ